MRRHLLEMLNLRLLEQTQKLTGLVQDTEQRILGGLLTRLDGIAADLKLVGERVASVEAEVAEIRSDRDKVNERINNLDHKVCELFTLKERVGELEAKLSSQQMATQACELRMHGIPFLEGENLKTLYHKLCFSLQLTPPPKFNFPGQKNTKIFSGPGGHYKNGKLPRKNHAVTLHRSLPAHG
ncbi:uncharacterized protein [Drosophila takahashii]|uniref:uncharacterized protein isoform X3 n=1 Tax=Drosophila takahashii TaxID=29030 RepID=UPI003898E446